MVNSIRTFICKKCNKYRGTRKGPRTHLKEKHNIKKEITNSKLGGKYDAGSKSESYKQPWWDFDEDDPHWKEKMTIAEMITS